MRKIRITLRSYNFKERNENIYSFNADSYQEVSIDWLTVTLKYDNHGGGQAMLLSNSGRSWDEVRDRLIGVH